MAVMAKNPKGSQADERPSAKKPRRSGVPLNLVIRAELRKQLDAYLDSTRPPVGITSAVETALEDFLGPLGFWPPPGEQSDAD